MNVCRRLIKKITRHIALKRFLHLNNLRSLKDIKFSAGESIFITIWDMFTGYVKILSINDTDIDIEVINVSMCYPSMHQAETGEHYNIDADSIFCMIPKAEADEFGLEFKLARRVQLQANWEEDVPF